jgi:hypothetical protein
MFATSIVVTKKKKICKFKFGQCCWKKKEKQNKHKCTFVLCKPIMEGDFKIDKLGTEQLRSHPGGNLVVLLFFQHFSLKSHSKLFAMNKLL